ncbi:hypothetical protein [Atopococcus tabaci]|uniref:hypothetical protein n=1 Tax=Atopococcus tabaci TaxID=269774 RepID=UPI0004865251|nr:hypothetical protein [Atopococcus tabaci]
MRKTSEEVLLVLVLNKTELLDELLIEWSNEDIKAATILDSIGMAKQLADVEDTRIISTLRPFLVSDHSENKLIFTILQPEDVNKARQIVRRVVGDLSQPETGILFALPLLFAEGIRF